MNRRESRVSFGPGAASLILIVVILSMSVLGILALMNARNDIKLSDRAAQVVQAGYALNAEAERRLATLDALAVICAGRNDTDEDYAADMRAMLLMQGDITMTDRLISWSHSDGRRTLNCQVELLPLGGPARLKWISHTLTAITEDAWN